jgi:tRNA pseudouridine13 synthase
MSLPDWARAYASVPLDGRAPLFAATIRTTPDEFDVTEELGFELSGEGEHDYLYVEKTGANTEWVGRQLAQFAAVPAKDVGYSGLKDRHAVTRQWFSVPRWNVPAWDEVEIEGVSILDVQRHSKKLRRGVHKANRFRIVLRGELPPIAELECRLALIREQGVPNYFGPQRFGRNGANLELADAWSAGRRLRRHKRSIAISSARSFLFNEQLHARVQDGTWNRIQSGDVANLDGTGSIFDVEVVDDTLIGRCTEMDIHPAGILWGDGLASEDAPPGHENWLQALRKARVKPAHRSLRLRVMDLEWQFGDDALTLRFGLGRGVFATSVLREIGDVNEA